MYPGLQSALLAEASAPLILLGGAILLYRSFRERYLLPWIAGWAIYTLSKLFLAISLAHGPAIWLVLANFAFVFAISLFSAAIFYYVYKPALLFPALAIILPAVLLGILQAFWSAHASALLFIFGIFWRMLVWFAAARLIMFA